MMAGLEPRLPNPQLRPVASCPCRLDPLQVPEVVAVGAVQIGQRLLESHGRDLPEPRPFRGLLGERDDLSGQLHPPDKPQPGPVGVLTQPEPVVVDHPGAPEGSGERLTLCWGWVQPIAVSELHPHTVFGPWDRQATFALVDTVFSCCTPT